MEEKVRHWGAWLALGLLYFIPLVSVFPTLKAARLHSLPDLSVYPWVYLRGGQELVPEEKTIEVILVGDIFCGRDGHSSALDLRDVSSWLIPTDWVVGNLECVITFPHAWERDTAFNQANPPYRLFGMPMWADLLRQAGFDVLGVANNHAFDMGVAGFEDTIHYLRQSEIAVAGLKGRDGCEIQPVILNYGDLGIEILAFNAVSLNVFPQEKILNQAESILSWQDRACLLSEIQMAHQKSQAVIVSVHWGYEYEERLDPAQREISEELMEAGADLIIGHHLHVPQRVEIYTRHNDLPDGVIAYSLGNFLSDQQFGRTVHGMALRAFFDTRGLRAVQALPVLAGPKPRLLGVQEASSWLDHLMPEPKQMLIACNMETCFEQEESSLVNNFSPASSLFWSGKIDLTGDGIPEHVQRQAGRVSVYESDIEVWQSPETWDVVDLAMGDPDGDGRFEMMMAFWREDASGSLRSHPFIVGYRGGRYQETWGGSGVSDPILELELGDVDGDKVQELVVLERRPSGKQAVTVWDWHGWGFSLKWRSSEANYQGLRVMPGEGGANDHILVNQINPMYLEPR